MTALQIILGSNNILSAFVFIGISIPMVKRKIPMNGWYGIRIQKAFQSEELWYDINAYGGRQLIIWSLPILVAGVACFFVPLNEANPLPIIALAGGPIAIFPVIAVVKTLVYAGRK